MITRYDSLYLAHWDVECNWIWHVVIQQAVSWVNMVDYTKQHRVLPSWSQLINRNVMSILFLVLNKQNNVGCWTHIRIWESKDHGAFGLFLHYWCGNFSMPMTENEIEGIATGMAEILSSCSNRQSCRCAIFSPFFAISNHEEYVKVFLQCIKNAIENVMNRVKIVKEKVSKD